MFTILVAAIRASCMAEMYRSLLEEREASAGDMLDEQVVLAKVGSKE